MALLMLWQHKHLPWAPIRIWTLSLFCQVDGLCRSNANLRDFGLNGADSPPWSPRRVPPAHVWGEGPPRAPGYRSGGACYPITSPGGLRNLLTLSLSHRYI